MSHMSPGRVTNVLCELYRPEVCASSGAHGDASPASQVRQFSVTCLCLQCAGGGRFGPSFVVTENQDGSKDNGYAPHEDILFGPARAHHEGVSGRAGVVCREDVG